MDAFSKLKWYVQLLVVVLVCGGALGGVWYLMLSPITVEIQGKTKQVAELQTKVDKLKALQARYAQFKKEADALEARLEELKKILPLDKEIEHILSQVQASARNAGLKIQQGISRPVVDHDAYSEWPMEMQVLGDYHSLGAFFQKLRELPRIVNVGKLRVDSRSGSGPDGSPLSIGASYEATTFVYREISDAALAAETVKKAKK
jgi:type IV pilus assembly protein PilO